MPGSHIPIDGLWRCLCPSVDVTTLSKAFRLLRQPARRLALVRPVRPVRPISTTSKLPDQYLSTTSNSPDQDPRFRRIVPKAKNITPPETRPHDKDYREKLEEKARVDYLTRAAKEYHWLPKVFFEGQDQFTRDLHKFGTATIYEALKALHNVEDAYHSIVSLVEYLVRERGEKPNEILYESLIRANVDPAHGSADVARSLFKEMIDNDMNTPPSIYQALLEVTAAHPDYVLRLSTLRDMKNRWYTTTPGDVTKIIVGLLRDGQYELALERLEEAYKLTNTTKPWLYRIFVFVFGELGFHDESFQIVQHQLKVYGPNQPVAVWHFLLDVYSRDAYYPGITYIWHRMVTPGLLNPPDGTVLNVLNAASRHGDTELVTSTMRMLTDRGKRLDLHHYEALIHAHTLHGDVRRALNVLCIMHKIGLALDSSSTRSVWQLLKDGAGADAGADADAAGGPEATDDALRALEDLRQLYPAVPIAAFNVVLEATATHRGFNKALDLYRGVRHICAGGPDLATYHVLLAHCTLRRSMRSLLDEMEAFAIRPDRLTYDHLVRISTLQQDKEGADAYEPAFVYLERMEAQGWWVSRGTALALVRRCFAAEDGRVQRVIDKCRERGVPVDREVEKLIKKRTQTAKEQEGEEGGMEQGQGAETAQTPVPPPAAEPPPRSSFWGFGS